MPSLILFSGVAQNLQFSGENGALGKGGRWVQVQPQARAKPLAADLFGDVPPHVCGNARTGWLQREGIFVSLVEGRSGGGGGGEHQILRGNGNGGKNRGRRRMELKLEEGREWWWSDSKFIE